MGREKGAWLRVLAAAAMMAVVGGVVRHEHRSTDTQAVTLPALADDTDAAAQTGPVPGRLLVGLHPEFADADLSAALGETGATESWRVEQIHVAVIETPHGAEEATLARLREHPAVRYADQDRYVHTLATRPSDPYYIRGEQWNIDRVQAWQAWALLPRGATTTVAILDTGIDYDHPDFAGRISSASCDQFHGACGGAGGRVPARDENGHGTFIAGIIGANTNNYTGVASVSGGRVSLLPIKIANVSGTSPFSTIIDAYLYAADNGARVINFSFGGPCGQDAPQAFKDAVRYVESKDILIVAAAGNDGMCYKPGYPQNDSRVLAVAATDIVDNTAQFNERFSSDTGGFVVAAAPGKNVVSTLPLNRSTSGYGSGSGSSYAAPHVAAQAALLFQVPGATKAKVMDWIRRTCDPTPINNQCGGRINVYRSVVLALTGSDPGPWQEGGTPTPTPSPTPTPTATPVPVQTSEPEPPLPPAPDPENADEQPPSDPPTEPEPEPEPAPEE